VPERLVARGVGRREMLPGIHMLVPGMWVPGFRMLALGTVAVPGIHMLASGAVAAPGIHMLPFGTVAESENQ